MPTAFPISIKSNRFRTRTFPETKSSEWNSWKWQLQNQLKTSGQLKQVFSQMQEIDLVCPDKAQTMPVSVTPYYAGVISQGGGIDLGKTVLPSSLEARHLREEMGDPLNESHCSPVPSIVHRYPNRVLFLTTTHCAVYCRYCTRSRIVGDNFSGDSDNSWEKGIHYIRSNQKIREVIVSGGDPLTISTPKLASLLKQLCQIPHVKIVRIGTKIPLVLPQRITDNLVEMLKAYPPIFMNLHAVHPAELTLEARFALNKLAEAGIVLGSQTVLLKGINDSIEVLQPLMEDLLACRVRPYALFHCDMVSGTSHFRTSLEKGINLVEALRKESGGLCVPQYIADPPGGKVFLTRETLLSRNNRGYRLKNWEGKEIFFPMV